MLWTKYLQRSCTITFALFIFPLHMSESIRAKALTLRIQDDRRVHGGELLGATVVLHDRGKSTPRPLPEIRQFHRTRQSDVTSAWCRTQVKIDWPFSQFYQQTLKCLNEGKVNSRPFIGMESDQIDGRVRASVHIELQRSVPAVIAVRHAQRQHAGPIQSLCLRVHLVPGPFVYA